MIWLAHYDESGKYTWSGNATIGTNPKSENGVYVGARVDPTCQYHDFMTNSPVIMPTKPSEFHEFNYVAKQWEVNADLAWMHIKIRRNRLLTDTDWLITRATETTVPIQENWLLYRQALRDITLQADPTNIVWPTVPTV